ncbi:MAG: hypothetical protein HQ475_14005 [SAR202 cluster bacterium]|nr:hypothetical protein [SAR202 cluster bacterium]
MLIEQVFPSVVSEKSTLRERLLAEALTRGISTEYTEKIESIVPKPLVNAGAFLDRLTGLWRYEFGVPYDIAENRIWGTQMWLPVEHLFNALFCAHSRLLESERTIYLERLANPDLHHDTLVEMIPAHKVGATVPLDFEVAGLSVGNRTVDWVINPQGGRSVLLDVKRRTVDFVHHVGSVGADSAPTEPDHEPSLLFRNVEEKFVEADPDIQLQGVWIHTTIKQDAERLAVAYAALNASKVHFAILGDWKPDIYVLARKDTDRQYLLNLFSAVPSIRFTL